MADLLAGFGRVCITPPVGASLIGYASRTSPSLGVHDDLFASAVALSAGGCDVLLLALDVGWFDLSDVAALKQAVSRETGVAPEAILINTSHTHAGREWRPLWVFRRIPNIWPSSPCTVRTLRQWLWPTVARLLYRWGLRRLTLA